MKSVTLLLLHFAMLSLTLLLTSCGAPQTLKIGVVAPFEGVHRAHGYEVLFAVKLALQERNEGQGVAGYRIELVALNDSDRPTEASQQAAALITDADVIGVVGHLTADSTAAALPLYEAAEMPIVAPWAIDERDWEDGAATVAASEQQIGAILQRYSQELGITTLKPFAELSSAATVSVDEALFIDAEAIAAAEILQSLPVSDAPRFGGIETGSPQLVLTAGDAAAGLIYASPGPAPDDVDATSFAERYLALAGIPPGPRAVMAYDATQVLLDAIEHDIRRRGRTPERSSVRAGLPNVTRKGISGEIAFDGTGLRQQAPVWIYQIQNAQYPGQRLFP